MKWVRASWAALLASCASGDVETPTPAAPVEPARVVRVQGSCERARTLDAEGNAEGRTRPIGALERYRVVLHVRDANARVRANAAWPAGDERNVIGTLAGPTWVLGDGPLKNAEYGAGIGYAIAVEDDAGRRCRGYVSIAVAEPRASQERPTAAAAPP